MRRGTPISIGVLKVPKVQLSKCSDLQIRCAKFGPDQSIEQRGLKGTVKFVVSVLALLAATTMMALGSTAQEAKVRTAWAYGFYATGMYAQSNHQRHAHVGGGVEWKFHRSVGVASEFGAFLVQESAAPLLSLNTFYTFRDSAGEKTLVPFATAGYSRGPGPHLLLGASFLNAGAGVNYWLRRKSGVRFEVRHHEAIAGTCAPWRLTCRDWLLDLRVGLIAGWQ